MNQLTKKKKPYLTKQYTKKKLPKKKLNNDSIDELSVFKNISNVKETYDDEEKKFFYSQKSISDKNKTNDKITNELVLKIQSSYKVCTVSPKNDYYDYINRQWFTMQNKLSKTQEYLSNFDDSRIVQDTVYYKLRDIIEEDLYGKNVIKNTKFKNALQKYYESAIKLTPLEVNIKTIRNIIMEIDNIRSNRDNLWKMLAYVNKIEVISSAAPFMFKIDIQEHSNNYGCLLYSSALELLDKQVYVDDGTDISYKNIYRNRFFHFQSELYKIFLGEHNNLNPVDVFDVQKELLNCYINKDKNIHENTNNLNYRGFTFDTQITSNDALGKYGFNWPEYCKELGFETIPDILNTNNLNYFVNCTELLLHNWHTDKWRSYWIWIFVKELSRFTDTIGAETYFEFNGKFMRGEPKILPTVVRSITFTCCAFNKYLSTRYYEKYYNKDYVNYTKNLSDELLRILLSILERNIWLTEDARQNIINKIKKIRFKIGFSAEEMNLVDDPILDYDMTNITKNIWLYYHWRLKNLMKYIGKDSSSETHGFTNWANYPISLTGNQLYLVKIYYSPLTNVLHIPLGYIQPPFISFDGKSIEYNLANIGFSIARELLHSLDEYSLNLNEIGDLSKSLLTNSKDYNTYIKKLDNIKKQYIINYKKDNITIPIGNLTNSYADITALEICLEYLRDIQNKNNDISPICELSFESFFTDYAIRMKTNMNKHVHDISLKVNPTPLEKYICNIPLTRSKIFKTVYSVSEKDDMSWENTDIIW